MPANLNQASPVGTLPHLLFTRFEEQRLFPMLVAAAHRDGRIERSLITDTVNPASAVRSFQCSVRLCRYLRGAETSSQLKTLRTFFESHQGPLIPFTFYHPIDTPLGGYDPDGDSVDGRLTVRFTNSVWQEEYNYNMATVSFSLTEVV